MTNILADTNVWSLAYRSDTDPRNAYVANLQQSLELGTAVTTGIILLELIRGFTQPQSRETICRSFDALPFIEPTRADYAAAADLSITCRRAGVQLGSIDALIAQLCITNDLVLLTADVDFLHAARCIPLVVCNAS